MFKSISTGFLTICITMAHAENIANLVVLNDVQTGMWTLSYESTVKSPLLPNKPETACLTKSQIIKNFSKGLITNTKTGEEIYPTVLSTNMPNLGVAEVHVPGAQIGAVAIPASAMYYTIKRLQKDKWVMTMTSSGTKAQLAATATYHGEKTASCGGKMEEEDSEIIANKAEGKIKFRDADNSCKDYPYLLKAIPKFSAYGGYTFDKAECKAYKEKFTDKDIFQVSLVIHYKNVAEKTNMHIGFTDYLNNKNKLGVNIQLEKFNNPNNSDDVARSNLKIFDHAMTAFGNVGGHPDYKAIDFEHGIGYAQYSGNHKNRYNLVVDIYRRELMNEVDVDNFMKEYLEAFKFRELR